MSALVPLVNKFMLQHIPRYRKEMELEGVALFSDKNILRLIELFFNWLTHKKYLNHKIRINEHYTSSPDS